jgi:hypothetical protein
MKKQIKSYTALIPKEYLWGMAAAAPVALIAINALLERYIGLLSVLMCFWLYSFLDIFLDYWIFGGICAKSGNRMEYVKSSFYGYQILKNSIIGDEVRRFGGMAVVAFGTMGCYCFSWQGGIAAADLCYIGLMVLMPFFLNTAALNVSRYLNTRTLHNMVACVASSASLGLLAAKGAALYGLDQETGGAGQLIHVLVVFAVLSAAAAVLTVWHMLIRVKQSYRDGEC